MSLLLSLCRAAGFRAKPGPPLLCMPRHGCGPRAACIRDGWCHALLMRSDHARLACAAADGIAFHANSSDALVDEWSSAVLRLQVRMSEGGRGPGLGSLRRRNPCALCSRVPPSSLLCWSTSLRLPQSL